MDRITCNVCMDLMPLVQDGVASEDSRSLVMEHIASCEHCAAAFGTAPPMDGAMDDALIVRKIKRRMTLFLLGLIFAGTLIGLALSDGMGMFYNAIIMPAIGAFGYLLLRKKALYVPLGLFLFSLVWVAVREAARGFLTYSTIAQLLVMSAWWSVIFAGLSALGVLIARLLCYAFKKGELR